MKFLAEISITPTSFELASCNFVRINFKPFSKCVPKDLLITQKPKYQGAMIFQSLKVTFSIFWTRKLEQFPKIQILTKSFANLYGLSSYYGQVFGFPG